LSDLVRVLHTGDFHIGAPYRKLRGKNVEELRRGDIKRNFVSIVDRAIAEKVDLFLISGDVFHSPRPYSNDFVFFSEQIGRLTGRGVKVVVIAGNHDKPKSRDFDHQLSALVKVHAPNFYFLQNLPDEPLIIDLEEKSTKVGIVALPYVEPRFVEELCVPYNSFVRGEIKRLLDFDSLGDVDFKILVAHLVVSGAVVREIPSLYLRDPRVGRDDLLFKEFDYVALGHVHQHQRLADNMYYCGSIERLDFSEINDEKFFNIVNLSGEGLTVNEIPLSLRPMYRISYDKLSSVEDPIGEVIEFIKRWGVEQGSIVKLVISGDLHAVGRLKRSVNVLERKLEDDLNIVGYDLEIRSRRIYGDIKKYSAELKYNLREIILDYVRSLTGVSEDVKKRALKFAEEIIDEVGLP